MRARACVCTLGSFKYVFVLEERYVCMYTAGSVFFSRIGFTTILNNVVGL